MKENERMLDSRLRESWDVFRDNLGKEPKEVRK